MIFNKLVYFLSLMISAERGAMQSSSELSRL